MAHDATDLLAVEQRHRDAAWPFIPTNSIAGQDRRGFFAGAYDECNAVQAFAQFEATLAVTNAQQAATIAAMREATAPFIVHMAYIDDFLEAKDDDVVELPPFTAGQYRALALGQLTEGNG